ncbi:MAG: hypothetical protein QNJ35_14070 [Paracoccaceae bacterium]|nr:hypothetical protein [Paracoccaceae bacterium]
MLDLLEVAEGNLDDAETAGNPGRYGAIVGFNRVFAELLLIAWHALSRATAWNGNRLTSLLGMRALVQAWASKFARGAGCTENAAPGYQ